MATYTIATDDGLAEIEAATLAEAFHELGYPTRIQTSDDWKRWIADAGGFGAIHEGDVIVARVSAASDDYDTLYDSETNDYVSPGQITQLHTPSRGVIAKRSQAGVCTP